MKKVMLKILIRRISGSETEQFRRGYLHGSYVNFDGLNMKDFSYLQQKYIEGKNVSRERKNA